MYIRAPQYLENVDSPHGAKFVRTGVKLSEFSRGNLQILLSTRVPSERGADDRVLTKGKIIRWRTVHFTSEAF